MPAEEDEAAVLDELTNLAEAEWPAFRVARESFQEKLLAVVNPGPDRVNELRGIRAVDLYLAVACAQRIEPAVKTFVERYLVSPGRYVRRLNITEVELEEIQAQLEDKLLVGASETEPGRIAQYSGRGPLEYWVAIAAQRTGFSMLRSKGREHPVEEADVLARLWTEAESSQRILSARYEAALRESLRDAISSLELRQRTILRLSMIDGISLSKIARMLHVNQSTVSRALRAALDKLNAELRRQLGELHRLRDHEIDSIVRDLRAHIDLSLSKILEGTLKVDP
jgi:RNA polymerase sigma-70 factor, ECF subfamily